MLFQPVFIGGAVVSVPGEAVHFPGDDILPVATLRFPEHSLKLRALIVGAGQVAVGVHLNDLQIVHPGKRLTVRDLLLYGGIVLGMGGIPGVDYGELCVWWLCFSSHIYAHPFWPSPLR